MVRRYALLSQMLTVVITAASLMPQAIHAANQNLTSFKGNGLTGDLHFGGALVAASCRISLDTPEQTIDMGEHNTHEFRSVGDTTAPVTFGIHIQDCLTTHYINNPYTMTQNTNTEGSLVRIAFFGEGAGAEAPELLGGGGLHGVGLRLMDSEGHLLPLGHDSDPLPLHLKNDTLPLQVALQSTAPQRDIHLGHFHTMATFRLSYR